MPVKVNKDTARRILQEEALRAQTEAAPGSWKECVENLSRACEETRIRSHVAVLGNAMLAKATNLDVDPFSLKARDDSAGAYSARGIADNVLGPWANQVGLDIGVSGPNPLNNQPFFHAARVSPRMEGVKGGARRPLEVLCGALTLVSRIRNERTARDALRAFIQVRQVLSAAPPSYEFSAAVAEAPLRELIEAITKFVKEDSEGGKRAQAVAAGLLDVLFGPERVITKRVNDPSRDSPGDVGILRPGNGSDLERVFEVRDKPVATPEIRRFVRKVSEARIDRAGIVSVASARSSVTPELFDFSTERGVVLQVFPAWEALALQVAFWSTAAARSLPNLIHERVYERLREIEVLPQTLTRWQSLR